MTQHTTPESGTPNPPSSQAAPQWERDTLEKVLMASVEEQRRSRRWGIFFKSLLAIYLGVAMWMTFKPFGGVAGKAGDAHTAVIDVVGGPHWAELLAVLRGGGRYAVSGAIAGPMVTLDLRTLYLKDLALHGCTRQDRAPFLDMLDLARDGSLRPPVARSFPLAAIGEAQALFQTKSVVGKIVLVPPAGA